MVALVSLPNPFATFISYKAHKTPTKTLIQCSIRVPSSSLRRTRRKNYLRPKILKTLTKPYNVPSDEPIADPIKPMEPDVEVPLETVTEKLDASFVEELEMTPGLDESKLNQVEVVRGAEGRNLAPFNGFSGRTVRRVVGSFVGLFILQSVVAAWITGSGNSDEKNGKLLIEDRKRNLRVRMQEGEVGLNGNALPRNWAGLDVDESEVEAKISEIRKMASEVREAERRKKVESGEADTDDVSDDYSEDIESDNSRINSGIVKEVDGRLSKLSKKIPVSSMNVNFVNTLGEPEKEGKDEGLNGKEEDNMLFIKKKQKYRSQMTTPKDKPKGFQSTDDVREKHDNVDDGNAVERIGTVDDVKQSLNAEGAVSEKRDDSADKEGKIPVSQSSKPLKGSRKRSGSSNAKKKLGKGINGDTTSGSNGTSKRSSKGLNEGVKSEKGSTPLESNVTEKKLSKGLNEGDNPERGLVQESSNGSLLDEGAGVKKSDSNSMSTPDRQKMKNHVSSTSSETLLQPGNEGQPHSNRRGSKLPQGTYKEEKENADPWWSKLPYVLVILMQKGIGNEAERGFYNITMDSVADSESNCSYTVAFEDRNDAQNFSYLVESAFEDLPDAAVDIAPLSKKDFKEVVESLENKVVVVRKGELKLYAGQPLADAEAALRSLLK